MTREVVPDERPEIEETLVRLAAAHALIVTTGGTGFGPRDVTPEATKAVLDREAPGLAELMRTAGLAHTPMAALSRADGRNVGDAVVVNLPGSPKGVRESLDGDPPRPAARRGPAGRRDRRTSHRPPGRARDVARTSSDGARGQGGRGLAAVPGRDADVDRARPGRPHGTLGCAEFDQQAVEAAAESGDRASRAPACCTTTTATSRSSSSRTARRPA